MIPLLARDRMAIEIGRSLGVTSKRRANIMNSPYSARSTRRSRAAYALAVVMAVTAPSAFGNEHLVEVEWGAAGNYVAEIRIPSRKFRELCVALKKGERVAWSFSSSTVTTFNIHYHVGKEVSYPAKVEGIRSGDGVLAVPADQHYCWMWKADASSVDLTAKLNLERRAEQ